MKPRTLLLIGAGLVLTKVSILAETTIASELERGVELLESGEDLMKAKGHLEMVIHRQKESRRIAAEAYYQLAKCHLAMDEHEEARKCVSLLREGWPDENIWVVRAGKLPLRNGTFADAPWSNGELLTYGMEVNHEGELMSAGKFFSLIIAGEATPTGESAPLEEDGGEMVTEEKWTVWSGGTGEVASFVFGGDDFRPYRGRLVSTRSGNQVMATSEDGELILRPFGVDRPSAKFAADDEGSAVYHQLQLMELVRVLPSEIGKSYAFPLIAMEASGEVMRPKITATGEAELEVLGGKFGCVVYEIDFGTRDGKQTYWVEKGKQRRVLKITFGDIMTTTLLSSLTDWIPGQSHVFNADDFELKVPGGLVAIADPQGQGNPLLDLQAASQVGLYDTQLRVWGGLVARLPVPEHLREEMEAEGFNVDSVGPMVERMKNSFSVGPMGLAEVEEIKTARKVIKADGDTSVIARLTVRIGASKHERTVLLSFESGAVLMSYFDHETGAGESAVELLTEIRRNL